MSDKDIIKITKVNNINVVNTHNDYVYPTQDILEIEFRNGEKRTLDLIADRDITGIDYFEIKESYKTTRKVLFEEDID